VHDESLSPFQQIYPMKKACHQCQPYNLN